jgi:hypothetical protein
MYKTLKSELMSLYRWGTEIPKRGTTQPELEAVIKGFIPVEGKVKNR